jgi:uncharacterized membrane protein YcaP (DUF421 family)
LYQVADGNPRSRADLLAGTAVQVDGGHMDVDWEALFTFSVPPLELVLRGTLTYIFLFCLFRFVVRRDAGALGLSDLLVLVIIADAAQNAMAGDYVSIVDGFLLIGTIIGWNYILNWLSFRYPWFRRFALAPPICIIKDGVKQDRALQRELISDEELRAMLHEHEVDDIAQVKRAWLEPDGQLTVLRRRTPRGSADDRGAGGPPRRGL